MRRQLGGVRDDRDRGALATVPCPRVQTITVMLKYDAPFPPAFWGLAWDHVEEGMNLMPTREPPHASAFGTLICDKVKGAHRNPWACLCYATSAPRLPLPPTTTRAPVCVSSMARL